jgi:hypothetical protein
VVGGSWSCVVRHFVRCDGVRLGGRTGGRTVSGARARPFAVCFGRFWWFFAWVEGEVGSMGHEREPPAGLPGQRERGHALNARGRLA